MSTPMFATTGEAPRIVRVEALAFHDASGRIRHMHHHVVLEGAEPRSIQSMLDEVKAQALALGNDVSKLRVLHVKEAFDFSAQHRVDVKKGVLVELKPLARSSAPRAAAAAKKKKAPRKKVTRKKKR